MNISACKCVRVQKHAVGQRQLISDEILVEYELCEQGRLFYLKLLNSETQTDLNRNTKIMKILTFSSYSFCI